MLHLSATPRTILCALALAALLISHAPAQAVSNTDKRIVGYFTEWKTGRDYPVAKIPATELTHVNYAFAVIKDGKCAINDAAAAVEQAYPGDPTDDTAPFRGHFRQLQVLKKANPHLKTLVSIGGWGGSGPFYEVAASQASRDTFAKSCAQFAHDYGFDGIDIDWEFPGGDGADAGKGGPEDTRNFTLLLQSLRGELDRQGKADGKQYLLTIAASAGPQKYKRLELDQIARYVDWINLMAYDLAGVWDAKTGFNAPLYAPKTAKQLSVDDAVRAYLEAGVPPRKLVVGVPFYGHAFGGVGNADHGLAQPHNGKSPQPLGGGEWTYRKILSNYLKAMPRYWDESAKAPWLFDEKNSIFVTYDDPESLRAKAAYVREKGLGGVMIWELSQDDDQSSLLQAIRAGLKE